LPVSLAAPFLEVNEQDRSGRLRAALGMGGDRPGVKHVDPAVLWKIIALLSFLPRQPYVDATLLRSYHMQTRIWHGP
jgi:hypothetical protein